MASHADGDWTMAERWEYHHAGYDGLEVREGPKTNSLLIEKEYYSPSQSSDPLPTYSTYEPQHGLIPTGNKSIRSSGSFKDDACRSCWNRHRTWLAVITILVIIGLAVAIPVAIVLTRHQNSSPAGPVLMDNLNNWTLSTNGAYNGSGLATIIPSSNGNGQIILFSQHFNGELRQSMEKDGLWAGGTTADVVLPAGKARPATPLTATTYTNGGNETWRLFYIDEDSILQELIQVNRTGIWQRGSLGDLHLEASESPNAGLSLLRARTGQEGWSSIGEAGIYKPPPQLRLHYAHKADNRVHELTCNGTSTQWQETFVFPEDVNANAGFMASMPWVNQSLYFFASSMQNELLLFTRSFDQNSVWQETKVQSSAQLRNSSSICFGMLDNAVVYQDPSEKLFTIAPNFTQLDAPWGQPKEVDTALPGTRISCKYNTDDGANLDYLYFQVAGNDLKQYSKGINSTSSWTAVNAPTD